MHPLRVSVRAVCYRDDTLLLAEHRDDRGLWYILPGGGIQHNETLDQALSVKCLKRPVVKLKWETYCLSVK